MKFEARAETFLESFLKNRILGQVWKSKVKHKFKNNVNEERKGSLM